MAQRLAALVRFDLGGDEGGDGFGRRHRGVVRADIDGGVAPEARLLRQGLALEHIERRALEAPGIERGENIGFDLQAAAPGVDEDGTAEPAALPEFS